MLERQIRDVDFAHLASIAGELRHQYETDDAEWEGSPFQWIRCRPSRQRGAIFERIVSAWCQDKGFSVTRSANSDADLVIEGHRVEVKGSTLWTDQPQYKFQQIRDQQYDFCFCLGVSPFDVHAWYIPKSELMDDQLRQGLRPQHGGQSGSDTRWLSFLAQQPPEWLAAFGGTLSEVQILISAQSAI